MGHEETRRREPREHPWWRRGWTWTLALATAALVAIAWMGRGPDWTIVAAPAEGVAWVEGKEIPCARLDQLERAIRRGGTLRLSGETALELMAGAQMAIVVAPGTDATLPPAAGRWLARSVVASVRTGHVRIATGKAFAGARLQVITPEASVEVLGTTLAVFREAAGTCVCVMEGRVRMGSRDQPMAEIGAGMRRFFYRDRRPAEDGPMRPVEKGALSEMKRLYADRLE